MGYRCRPQPHAPLEATPNLKQQARCWGCPTHTEHLAARLAQPQAARTAQSTARPCSELKVSRNKKFFACRVSPAVPNPGGISQVAEPQPWASPPSCTAGDAQPQPQPPQKSSLVLPPPKPEVHPEPSPAELWVPKQSTRSPQLGHLPLSATTDTQPRSEPLEQFPSLPRSCTQTAHPCPSPSSSPPHQAHEPQLHLAASPAPSHPLPLIS